MADTQDYLTVYRRFFEEFATTVNPDDQLPVKVAGYYLCDSEIVGEIVDWTLQYLNQKHCPSSLVAPLTRIVIDEIKFACKKQPAACGYRPADNTYQPLKLMQVVTGKVNEVCLRYCDNGKLVTLPPPSPGPPISSCAIKNTRRRMEDRHVIIEDFNAVFDIQDRSPTSYYAVFDGHAGTDAAVYSVSHLHQFLAESSFYPTDPERALKDAFSRTDSLFLEKSNRENLVSGTTALCALLRPKENMLYVAWLGDSQAILVRKGQAIQVVNPHKADRQDERERIEDMGGCVLFWGTWRVNGQLAVSRAIGDLEYKPYVTAEPDVTALPLNGTEDFLVLACDGLWDFVTDQQAVAAVYQQISKAPGDIEAVSQRLVQLSKQQGSTDNITVIVVFLTEPAQLASRPIPLPQEAHGMETSFDPNTNSTSAGSNPLHMSPASDSVPYQKGGLLLDLGGEVNEGQVYKHNGTSPSNTDLYFLDRPANGSNTAGVDSYEDSDDFGPETDVDAVDDVLLSPASAKTAALNNNLFGGDESRSLEADLELQRQQLSDFDPVREPREETPTPPADEVPGVTTFVPESDNVAESGEDSEDEWNYYRVEPSVEGKQEATQPNCQKPAEPQLEDRLNMESQLNPDAAEFVPSPTQILPSMEEALLSHSPSKDIPVEDISVHSQFEFQHEISQRLSELDLANESPLLPESKMASKLPDLINNEDGDNGNPFISSSHHLDNGGVLDNILEQEQQDVIFLEQQDTNVQGLMLDESEVTSTKAEFGDDSTSFLATGSELQKTATESVSSSSVMEKSFTDLDLPETEFTSSVAKSDNGIMYCDNNLSEVKESEVCMNKSTVEETALHEDGNMLMENVVPVCFEVQKELVPEMESEPERVQLENEGALFVDDSGFSLQAEDKQLGELEESAIISFVPDLPLTSPVPDLHPLVPEEKAATAQIQDTSLQDLLTTAMPSSPAEPPISYVETETASSKSLQSPPSLQAPPSPVLVSTSPIPTSRPEIDTLMLEMEAIAAACAKTHEGENKEDTDKMISSPPPHEEIDIQQQLGEGYNPPFSNKYEDGMKFCEEQSEIKERHSDNSHENVYLWTSEHSIPDPLHTLKQEQGAYTVTPPSELSQHLDSLVHDEQFRPPECEMMVKEMISAAQEEKRLLSQDTEVTPLIHPVEAEVKESVVMEILPPIPMHFSEETLLPSTVQTPPEPTKPVQVLEKIGDAESKGSLVSETTTVTTTGPAGAVVTHEKPAKEAKAPEKKVDAKKPTPSKDKKEPVADKTKQTKTPTSTKNATPTSTVRISQKSTPTSPMKPPSTTLRSSTPKKSVMSSLPPAGRTTKSPATASKPKPGVTSPTKPLSSTSKPASVSPRTRPGTTTLKSPILSEGDVAKPALAKKTTTFTAAKPQSRPAVATATTKTETTKQMGTITSRTTPVLTVPPRPKVGVESGMANKSRPAGTVATVTARNKVGSSCNTKLVTDRQVKETANKQISSSHTITSKTTTVTTARNVAATATRRVAGVTKTTVKTSTGKVGPKKTACSMTISGSNASTTASNKMSKTEVTVTSAATENNEIVQVEQVN